MALKKRVLWVEDFNEGNNTDLKKRFLCNAGLDESDVDWAENLNSALSKLSQYEEIVYDLIILDVNFPAGNEMPIQLKECGFSEDEYKSKCINSHPGFVKKTGFILYQYLVQVCRFSWKRICFFSGNLYKTHFSDLTVFDDPDDPEKFGDWIEKHHPHFIDQEFKKELSDSPNSFINGFIDEHLELFENEQEELNILINVKEDFKHSFTVMPRFFGKFDGLHAKQKHRRLYQFIHDKDEAYYCLRNCIINMCEIVREKLTAESIERKIFIKEKKDKYKFEDYKQLLQLISSNVIDCSPSNKNQVYRRIIHLVSSFMENTGKPEFDTDGCAAQSVMKFVRNMDAHNLLPESLDEEFTAFIFGIGMRTLFKEKFIDALSEYLDIEKTLLCLISNKEKEELSSSELIIRIKELYKEIQRRYEKARKGKLFKYSYDLFDAVKSLADERICPEPIEKKYFYWLYAFCINPLKTKLAKGDSYVFYTEVSVKHDKNSIWHQYLRRISATEEFNIVI